MEVEVNDSNFDKKVLEESKKKLVLVDFWAPWCGPCRMLAPQIEKAVESMKGKVVLAKVNVDENPKKAQEYGVMSIPSVKLFKNGEIIDEFIGVKSESEIKELLEENV